MEVVAAVTVGRWAEKTYTAAKALVRRVLARVGGGARYRRGCARARYTDGWRTAFRCFRFEVYFPPFRRPVTSTPGACHRRRRQIPSASDFRTPAARVRNFATPVHGHLGTVFVCFTDPGRLGHTPYVPITAFVCRKSATVRIYRVCDDLRGKPPGRFRLG